MRQFRYYVETEPGLVVRRATGAFYGREAEIQAETMVGHFGRLWARPELAGLRARRFAAVLAWGGGMPAFECGLQAERIEVADPLHGTYRELEGMFRGLHPEAPPIGWQDAQELAAQARRIGADCVSFCHVLEHVPIRTAETWLRAVPTTADIVIYGPNADRMHEDWWLHAQPVHEHLWIPGLSWMRPWAARTAGRPAAVALAHDEDLLIWLPAAVPRSASDGRGDVSPADPPGMGATAGTGEYSRDAVAPVAERGTAEGTPTAVAADAGATPAVPARSPACGGQREHEGSGESATPRPSETSGRAGA